MSPIPKNSWLVPVAAFAVAGVLAFLTGPALSAASARQSMGATGTTTTGCVPCDPCGRCVATASGAPLPPCPESDAPVFYFTGEKRHVVRDLGSGGFGGWGHSRAYVMDSDFNDGPLGPSWRVSEIKRLLSRNGQVLVLGGSRQISSFTDNGNGTYSPVLYYKETLIADTLNHVLRYTDTTGQQWVFFDFSATWTFGMRGKLKEFRDPFGNVTTTIWSSTPGPTFEKILEIQQTHTDGTTAVRYVYTYYLTGIETGLIQRIALHHLATGSDVTVRQVDYTFYQAGDANGPVGTLKRAAISQGGLSLDTYYYRYYAQQGLWAPLRYIVEPHAYERLKAARGGTDGGVDTADDATTATYADYYFEYDFANRRVTKEVVQGKGCGCGTAGGRGTYSFQYIDAPGSIPIGINSWRRKIVETLPDLNQNIVYLNSVGQMMVKAFKDTSGASQWITYYRFDANGRVILEATSSAVLSYDEALPELVGPAQLRVGAGLMHGKVYFVGGATDGFLSQENVQQGQGSPPVLKRSFNYVQRAGTNGSILKVSQDTRYRNSDGTGALSTTMSYTWQGSSDQADLITTTFPIVTALQNGSAVATTKVSQYDAWGREIWTKDEDGFIQAAEYDIRSGGITKQIADVNTALVANEPAGWVTPAGGGLHLTTVQLVDAFGRVTKRTDPAGTITHLVYKDDQHEVRTYPGWTGTATTGPTRVEREDRTNSYSEKLTMSAVPAVSGGAPTGAEAISSVLTLSRESLDTGDRVVSEDTYFNLSGLVYSPAPNLGVLGTNYLRKALGYDLKGRKDREQDWTGTITRWVFDVRDQLSSTWIGTDDTPTSGDWTPLNTGGTNLVIASDCQYDGGTVANGTLTRSRVYTAAGVSLDTFRQYDFQDRLTQVRSPYLVAGKRTLDNVDRMTILEIYADADANFVIGATELRAKVEYRFDDKGHLYQYVRHKVDPVSGAIGSRLTDNFWSNGRGLVAKSRGSNGNFRKSSYDGLGRPVGQFVSFDAAETLYADALTLTNDTVIEQISQSYDANGNILLTTMYQRVAASAKTGDLSVSWAVADSRRSYVSSWFDLADRMTSVVDYGTNGGVALTRPPTAPLPNTSASTLVTKIDYDAAGRRYRTTDNKNHVTQQTLDAIGRPTRIVENFVDGTAAAAERDTDRSTDYLYDASGRILKQIVFNAKGGSLQQQTTLYAYGTIATSATPPVFRNDVLTAVIYPDSDDTWDPLGPAGAQLGNGANASYDRVELTYDYASRLKTRKDQRGSIRTLTYDAQGRLFTDAVTTLGSGVDGAVRRQQYAYDGMSRLLTATSYSAASGGTLVNQLKSTYDGWGNEIKREESHVGAVVAGTPSVQKTYAEGASPDALYVRLSQLTYPNGRALAVTYAAGISDKLNRADSMATGAATHAQYTYLGETALVKLSRPEVTGGLILDYEGPTPTGAPTGWDIFGRVTDQKWRNTAGAAVDQYQYGYDFVSNRTFRDNLTTTGKDQFFTVDGLNRSTNAKRGDLTAARDAITGTPATEEALTLESVGNWSSLVQKSAGTTTLSQTRTHNAANELTTIGASVGTNWIDGALDKAGNMTKIPQPANEAARLHLTYDAWNRLVIVKADDGTGLAGATIAEYQYDAGHRRVVKLKPNGVNWDRRDYYHSMEWQVIEERELLNSASKTTAATLPRYQSVWDPQALDALVLRDENKDGDNDCAGAADQRLYATQDANGNVTALVTKAGAVVERYFYDVYGKATFHDGAWTALVTQASAFGNEVLYAGYRHDPESGLYHVRNRAYHPTLGRWIQRDPLDYVDGGSLYEYVRGMVAIAVDALGLQLTPEQEAHRKQGETEIKGSLAGLKALCDDPKCCPCKPCTAKKCKDDADKIVTAFVATWNHNYGKGKNSGPHNAGGYLCWDWANIFNATLQKLAPECWAWSVKEVQRSKNTGKVHFFIALYACKRGAVACTKFYDDGFISGFVHDPPWPPPDEDPTDGKWVPGGVMPPGQKFQPFEVQLK